MLLLIAVVSTAMRSTIQIGNVYFNICHPETLADLSSRTRLYLLAKGGSITKQTDIRTVCLLTYIILANIFFPASERECNNINARYISLQIRRCHSQQVQFIDVEMTFVWMCVTSPETVANYAPKRCADCT